MLITPKTYNQYLSNMSLSLDVLSVCQKYLPKADLQKLMWVGFTI